MSKLVKGTQDLISQTKQYQLLENSFFSTVKKYNFTEIRTPILEEESLFKRSVGESSDIVQKEMFKIIDEEKALVLRPEGTAPVVRAIINSNLVQNCPLRFSYVGNMFRKERPQKGRLRQFNQYGFEIFGESCPSAEIETLLIVKDFYESLNFDRYEIQCNFLGNKEDREKYKQSLLSYLEEFKKDLSVDSQRRLESNVLRILDSKNENDQKILKNAPSIQSVLCEESNKQWEEILSLSKLLNIDLKINPKLVRGLDYYSGFVFEVVDTSGNLGTQSALGGGGRYDGLVEELGGPKTSGFGFGGGVERLILALNLPLEENKIDVGFVFQDQSLLPELLKLKRELVSQGLTVDLNFNYSLNFKKQFKRLDKIKCKKAVIIGQEEISGDFVKIKDLSTGQEFKILKSFKNLEKSNIMK